jgi:hypothetical protein
MKKWFWRQCRIERSNVVLGSRLFTYKAYSPWQRNAVTIKPGKTGNAIEINVPLIREAAMLKITKGSH